MTSIEEPNGMRRMMDTLVAGYLGRQHYTNTMRSMMRESPILKANIVEDIGIPIMLNDTVHGKHLEEILILFNHYGRFNFSTDFVDFGHRLRCLVNEYSSLIGMYSEWSESQRTLYGRHVPNSAQARKFQLMQQEPLTIASYDGLDSHHHGDQGPCSAGSSDHNATRRKCHQPININDRKSTKKSQVLAELVEPLTQLSQYVHDAGLIQSKLSAEDSLQSAQSVQQLADTAVASEQLGTSQSVSLISIDDNAIGSLDRCLGRENMYDLISQIERDFPPNFFGDNNIQTQFVMDSDDPQSMYTSYADQSNLLQGSNTLENISDGNVNRVQDDYIVPLKCTSLSTPGANIFSGRNSESSTSNSCEGGKELMFSSVGDLQTDSSEQQNSRSYISQEIPSHVNCEETCRCTTLNDHVEVIAKNTAEIENQVKPTCIEKSGTDNSIQVVSDNEYLPATQSMGETSSSVDETTSQMAFSAGVQTSRDFSILSSRSCGRSSAPFKGPSQSRKAVACGSAIEEQVISAETSDSISLEHDYNELDDYDRRCSSDFGSDQCIASDEQSLRGAQRDDDETTMSRDTILSGRELSINSPNGMNDSYEQKQCDAENSGSETHELNSVIAESLSEGPHSDHVIDKIRKVSESLSSEKDDDSIERRILEEEEAEIRKIEEEEYRRIKEEGRRQRAFERRKMEREMGGERRKKSEVDVEKQQVQDDMRKQSEELEEARRIRRERAKEEADHKRKERLEVERRKAEGSQNRGKEETRVCTAKVEAERCRKEEILKQQKGEEVKFRREEPMKQQREEEERHQKEEEERIQKEESVRQQKEEEKCLDEKEERRRLGEEEKLRNGEVTRKQKEEVRYRREEERRQREEDERLQKEEEKRQKGEEERHRREQAELEVLERYQVEVEKQRLAEVEKKKEEETRVPTEDLEAGVKAKQEEEERLRKKHERDEKWRREREEIDRQRKELEERERRRALEVERRRKEEEEKERKEREWREKKRREKESRLKGKDRKSDVEVKDSGQEENIRCEKRRRLKNEEKGRRHKQESISSEPPDFEVDASKNDHRSRSVAPKVRNSDKGSKFVIPSTTKSKGRWARLEERTDITESTKRDDPPHHKKVKTPEADRSGERSEDDEQSKKSLHDKKASSSNNVYKSRSSFDGRERAEQLQKTKKSINRASDQKKKKDTSKNDVKSAVLNIDDLFDTFSLIPGPSAASRKEETNCSLKKNAESVKKVVSSGVDNGHRVPLIGGGHSARVGMVLEKALRMRKKLEHDNRIRAEQLRHYADISRKTNVYRAPSSNDVVSCACVPSGHPSERAPTQESSRKRILDLPLPPKPDMFPEITTSKETRVSRLRKYMPSKGKSSPSQESPPMLSPHSFTDSPSNVVISSPRPISSVSYPNLSNIHAEDLTPNLSPAPSSSPLSKKSRLDPLEIQAVIDIIHS